MATEFAAPKAKPLRLGVGTASQQYNGITPEAVNRELPDNLMGQSAKMTSNRPGQVVPMVSWIEKVKVRKGNNPPQDARMMSVVMQTEFANNEFERHLEVVDPKGNSDRAHANSVHNLGTSNAVLGMGKTEGQMAMGQGMIIARKARAGLDASGKQYPVTSKVIRHGVHANELYQKQESETGRATVLGDLVVFPDESRACQFPWAASFVNLKGNAEPQTMEEFYEYLGDANLQKATKNALLNNSKWAVTNENGYVSAADYCDGLLTDVDAALKRFAEATNQPFEDVKRANCVLYFFWDLRDEIQGGEGGEGILVNGVPLHEQLADAYLPHDALTRTEAVMEHGIVMPDPMRTLMILGGQKVDFTQHWLLQAVNANKLRPYCWGDGKLVRMYEGFAVESFIVNDEQLLKQGVNEGGVQVHLRSGLAIGNKDDFASGQVMGALNKLCMKASDQLLNYFHQNSVLQYVTKGKEFSSAFDKLVPGTREWEEEEVEEVQEMLKDLVALYQGADKDKADAERKANEAYEEWEAENPHATPVVKAMHKYDAHCRAGGAKLQTAVKQTFRFMANAGLVHMVTAFVDLPVDKSKAKIETESETAKRICEVIPRLNKQISGERCSHLKTLRAEDLEANKKKEEEEAEEKRKAAADVRKTERLVRKGEKQEKKDAEKNQKVKEINAKWNRMLAAGCCPTKDEDDPDYVVFRSECNPVKTMPWKEAEKLLRKGKLYLEKGPGKDKYYIFKGDKPEEGNLWGPKGGEKGGTEIVCNPRTEVMAPPKKKQRKSTSGPGGGGGGGGGGSGGGGGGGFFGSRRGRSPGGGLAPPKPPPEEAKFFKGTWKFEGGMEFRFAAAALGDKDGGFQKALSDGDYEDEVQTFAAAMAQMPGLAACINQEAGGLSYCHENKEYRLRVVPVLLPTHAALLLPNTEVEEEKDDDENTTVITTVFVDMRNVCWGNVALVCADKEWKVAHVANKVAAFVAEKYWTKTMQHTMNISKEMLMWLMRTNNALPSVPVIADRSLTTSAVPASVLGKRKATAEEPAGRGTNNSEASTSADNGIAAGDDDGVEQEEEIEIVEATLVPEEEEAPQPGVVNI